VVNCSGRGDKDVQTAIKYLKIWTVQLLSRLSYWGCCEVKVPLVWGSLVKEFFW
jgi:hypothetical protein